MFLLFGKITFRVISKDKEEVDGEVERERERERESDRVLTTVSLFCKICSLIIFNDEKNTKINFNPHYDLPLKTTRELYNMAIVAIRSVFHEAIFWGLYVARIDVFEGIDANKTKSVLLATIGKV